ncbi:MAG: CBS domain-containing protein [Pseudomonadota bacterium]
MDVNHVLSRKPLTGVVSIGPRETLAGLAALLGEKRIGAVVVLDEADRLVGVISERDVIRALGETGANALHAPVSRYMTETVQTTSPTENVFHVLDRMTEGRFRHMPVLDNGTVVGVVSIGDLVKARIEALQADNEALEEFIRS